MSEVQKVRFLNLGAGEIEIDCDEDTEVLTVEDAKSQICNILQAKEHFRRVPKSLISVLTEEGEELNDSDDKTRSVNLLEVAKQAKADNDDSCLKYMVRNVAFNNKYQSLWAALEENLGDLDICEQICYCMSYNKEEYESAVLEVAGRVGSVDIWKLLLERNEFRDWAALSKLRWEHNEDGGPLFHLASDEPEKVKLLLEHEAFDGYKLKNQYGRNGFLHVCYEDSLEPIKLLLQKEEVAEEEYNQADKSGNNCFDLAFAFDHLEMMKLLLESDKIKLKEMHNKGDGSNAFFLVCNWNKSEFVKLFLDYSDRLGKEFYQHTSASDDGRSGFLQACRFSHPKIVKLCLASDKMDEEFYKQVDDSGRNALDLARLKLQTAVNFKKEAKEVVDLLEASGKSFY